MLKPTRAIRTALLIAAMATAGGLSLAFAQTESPAKSAVAVPATVLSLGEIESRLTAQGVTIREIEIRDLLAEVEGRDASGKKIKMVIDRRTGETLSHKIDR
jgi:multidrug efflux pump subunit AcrA (membrane-fusion protein)